ncbi:LPS export ABC transporter permease LptG [bacterium]|nr:LPS export ABC transporter permease LptG [bacterium]
MYQRIPLLYRYLLEQFLSSLALTLAITTALFVIVDLFERIDDFIREGAQIRDVLSYIIFNIPVILHLMLPVAILVATVLSIGRLSQRSEITAMRACGMSLFSLAMPLLTSGMMLAGILLLSDETIVPWASDKVDEIYHLDIKRKFEKGRYDRSNFWFRSGERFYQVGYYNSRQSTLNQISSIDVDSNEFSLKRFTEARSADWLGEELGWSMSKVVEVGYSPGQPMHISKYRNLPLVIDQTPEDFYQRNREPETMSRSELKTYIDKLKAEGVSVKRFLVQYYNKYSFPFITCLAVLFSFPFALKSARSGTLTVGFVAAVALGFSYYVVHAFATSLGSAELIPPLLASWTANIIFLGVGSFVFLGMEH